MSTGFRQGVCVLALLGGIAASGVSNAEAFRARDLGIPFSGITGELNAITDVPGIEVGQVTLIEGEGELVVGTGPVRTGRNRCPSSRQGFDRRRLRRLVYAQCIR